MGDAPVSRGTVMIQRVFQRIASKVQRPAMIATVLAENWQQRHVELLDLVILDDIFPHLLSAFRIAEYNVYLQEFSNSKVFSTGTAMRYVNEKRPLKQVIAEYEQVYPHLTQRVVPFHPIRQVHARIAYMIFLKNVTSFLSFLEQRQLPFVFTLYPGGGFALNQPRVDASLRRVCASPYLRHIITTQTVTHEYLLQNGFVSPEQVTFIYGGVFPNWHQQADVPKRYYPHDKPTFDICFVAYKYVPHGRDKGYDTFIHVAKQLAQKYPDVRFHVVGTFSAKDIDVRELGTRISFYGSQQTPFFDQFYASMDIILSPNVPFVLAPGAFDGFPTGACIEAGLHGVAVFCTDPLGMNRTFRDHVDLVLIEPDVETCVAQVEQYITNPASLYRLAAQGQQTFRNVFALDHQMQPRLDLLRRVIANER